MIITCPNCQTKYQVADKTIGSAGRKVQCANCQQPWLATAEVPKPRPKPKLVETEPKPDQKAKTPPKPEDDEKAEISSAKGGKADKAGPDLVPREALPDWALDVAAEDETEDDQLFDEEYEAELDQAFEKAAKVAVQKDEEDRTPGAGRARRRRNASQEDEQDEVQQTRLDALYKRQKKLAKQSPMARLRRVVRIVSFVILFTLVGSGVLYRTDIVRAFPDLGGLYSSIGLGVNVQGLVFTDVRTVRTLRDGDDVMLISAKIENVSGVSRQVPPVLVSILDDKGQPMYQWKARAKGEVVGLGEAVAFETQLNSAPINAVKVHLVFASDNLAKAVQGTHAK